MRGTNYNRCMITFTLVSLYAKDEASRPENEKADGRDYVQHILSPTTERLEKYACFSELCGLSAL